MANVDFRRGATPCNRQGGPWTGQAHEYTVDAANATAIYRGAFVVQEADGNVTNATAGSANAILGAVVGVKVDREVAKTEHPGYLPASTAGTLFVAVADDNTYFIMQEDDGGSALTSAARGANVNFVHGTGSNVSGLSGSELDQDSVSASAELQLRLIDRLKAPDAVNDYGDNCDWVVKVNQPQLGNNSSGTGI